MWYYILYNGGLQDSCFLYESKSGRLNESENRCVVSKFSQQFFFVAEQNTVKWNLLPKTTNPEHPVNCHLICHATSCLESHGLPCFSVTSRSLHASFTQAHFKIIQFIRSFCCHPYLDSHNFQTVTDYASH